MPMVPAITNVFGSGAGTGARRRRGALGRRDGGRGRTRELLQLVGGLLDLLQRPALAVALPRRHLVAQLLHGLRQFLEHIGGSAQCLLDAEHHERGDQHHRHRGARGTRQATTLHPVDDGRQRVAHEKADEERDEERRARVEHEGQDDERDRRSSRRCASRAERQPVLLLRHFRITTSAYGASLSFIASSRRTTHSVCRSIAASFRRGEQPRAMRLRSIPEPT